MVRQHSLNPRKSLNANDVDVADIIEPEAVRLCGRSHEVALGESLVDDDSGMVELLEDPALNERLVAGGLRTDGRISFLSRTTVTQ